MQDLIDRQEAIRAFDDAGFCTHGYIVDVLKELPSAQSEIIRCKDCKYNVSSHKCLQPDSFFLVTADDFYCGYAERRTDE